MNHSGDHVVVRQRDMSVLCQHCGQHMRLELPVSIDVWLAAAQAFGKLHEGCPVPHGLNPDCDDPDSDICSLHADTPITWVD